MHVKFWVSCCCCFFGLWWRNPWVWTGFGATKVLSFVWDLVAVFYLSFCMKLSEWGELQNLQQNEVSNACMRKCSVQVMHACCLSLFLFLSYCFYLLKSCSHVSLWSVVDIAQSCRNFAFLRFLYALSCWVFVCGCCLALIMDRVIWVVDDWPEHWLLWTKYERKVGKIQKPAEKLQQGT